MSEFTKLCEQGAAVSATIVTLANQKLEMLQITEQSNTLHLQFIDANISNSAKEFKINVRSGPFAFAKAFVAVLRHQATKLSTNLGTSFDKHLVRANVIYVKMIIMMMIGNLSSYANRILRQRISRHSRQAYYRIYLFINFYLFIIYNHNTKSLQKSDISEEDVDEANTATGQREDDNLNNIDNKISVNPVSEEISNNFSQNLAINKDEKDIENELTPETILKEAFLAALKNNGK
uniref:Uncharacterized protein n=1 Tax=Glossina austeni TaxID=7395 RepID=A0A1A9UI24_GLOAU